MKNFTLKELRKRKKLNINQVAEKLNISKTYVHLLENGQRNPSDKLKIKMAELYGVSATTIFLASHTTKC